jgi:YesN/AraC family two-component response regulator
VPVVFYSLLEDQAGGSVLGLDYLTKPIGSVALLRALERQGVQANDCQGGRTILVVDDEPGILELHARIVQSHVPGCQVLKASDGQMALEVMEQQRPNLMLLDLMMPKMDGFALLEAMRARESLRDVPVIVLSAQTLTGPDMARLQQGVAAVLGKGLFSAVEVLAQIEDTLGRHKRLGSETQRLVRQIMAYIHENYATPLTRQELATHFGLSERHLNRCFRQETGVSLMTYFNRYRVKQAKALLKEGNQNITEIALDVGFFDSSYFGRVFRREVGVSPSAYRRGERSS